MVRAFIRCAAILAGVALSAGPVAAQPYGGSPSDFVAYWDVPAYKDFPYKGPEKAKGVLFWSHGVSGTKVQYASAPPDIIKDFARAGWDIVKIQRNNLHERGWIASGLKHVADLVERIKKARDQGYKYVIAAGQSYGGAISLEASARTDLLFGVLSFAPGHGSDACEGGVDTVRRIADNLQAQLAEAIVAVKAPRVVVSVAGKDGCQGYNDPSKIIHDSLDRLPSQFMQFDSSMPVQGHSAAYTAQFREWYGACVLAFLDPVRNPVAKEVRCPSPDPAPNFLWPTKYKVPSAAAVKLGTAPDAWLGGWGGAFRSETTTSAYDREICVAVDKAAADKLTATVAFGAGPDRTGSMTTAGRTLTKEGAGYAYVASDGYRLALAPQTTTETLLLSITSAASKTNWTGVLKRGC